MPQTRIHSIGPTLLQLTIYNRKTSETLPSITKSNSSIMFMRYLNLAILVSAVLSQSVPESANSNDVARQLGDFDWAIAPEDGYPIINFNDTNVNSEVIFKYNYTGDLSGSKYLEVQLFQNDCSSAPDDALAIVNNTDNDVLNINLDIIQETISTSDHYTEISPGEAAISFCLRVDYNYFDGNASESINFYETNVTITVDLTANFTLTGIAAERTSADSEAADIKLDYPVEAYICEDNNTLVSSPAALAQGSFLQVCVRIDESVSTDNILVEDILTFVVSQPLNPSSSPSETITNSVADPLTDKVCRESGICNVKTQLLSKFFTQTSPSDLQIDGVAILAFGQASLMPSSAPTGPPVARRLRAVPIRGLITGDDVKAFMAAQQKKLDNNNNDSDNNRDESGVSVVSVVTDTAQRMLQEGENQSDFGLEVGLQGINGESGDQGSSSDGGSSIIVAAVVLILLAAGGCFAFVACTRRNRKEEPKDIVDHDSRNANVGTYDSHQASVYSSSSSQQASHFDYRQLRSYDTAVYS
jgi:hypothetical protein